MSPAPLTPTVDGFFLALGAFVREAWRYVLWWADQSVWNFVVFVLVVFAVTWIPIARMIFNPCIRAEDIRRLAREEIEKKGYER